MHIIVLLGAVLLAFAAFAAIEAGLVASPFARVKLVVTGGRVMVVRGALGANARQLVADIIRAGDIAAGFITVSSRGKVRFSRSIPDRIRQQLRNVILL